jgi:preprotein translocase subunit YajC
MDYNIIIMLAMFVVIFFFFIRPQQKKAKEQDLFLDELKKGDRVVTTGGIIGKFTKGAISKETTDVLNATDEKKTEKLV